MLLLFNLNKKASDASLKQNDFRLTGRMLTSEKQDL